MSRCLVTHAYFCRCLSALSLAFASACEPAQAAPPITAAALAPDGRHVVLSSQRGVHVRSWPELKSIKTLATELPYVHDLAFSPGGQTLLVAGGAPAESGTVEIRAWPGWTLVRRVTHHADLVYRIAWSPDGTRWAAAGADGVCTVADADTGERLASYSGHSKAVLTIAWLPDGKTLVSAGADYTLRWWNGTTGEHLRTLDNHVGAVNELAIRPKPASDAPAIVASIGEDRTARLWQPSIGRLMRFTRLPSPPRTLAWTAGGERLVIGCNDGHVRIVDFESSEIVVDKPALAGRIHALLIDPQTTRILVAGEGEPMTIEP
jgi:WD40 repeat protein